MTSTWDNGKCWVFQQPHCPLVSMRQETRGQSFLEIHLDFGADLGRIVNVAGDIQDVAQLVFASPIYSGRL